MSVAFNEDIPLNQRISEDLYRWMSAETFNGCEPLFRYTLNDAEFQDFSTFIGGRWSLATLQAYDWHGHHSLVTGDVDFVSFTFPVTASTRTWTISSELLTVRRPLVKTLRLGRISSFRQLVS